MAREQSLVVEGLEVLRRQFPVPIKGIDSDNDSAFINETLQAYCQQHKWEFTRSRPYHKNDNAHVEQRNWTHVRQHFGYDRYDDPAVVPLLNALCKGALGQLLNHFLPTHKLVEKRKRTGRPSVRMYGPAQTPYARVLVAAEVIAEKKAELQRLHGSLNPFQLGREIERQKKVIEARRLLRA